MPEPKKENLEAAPEVTLPEPTQEPGQKPGEAAKPQKVIEHPKFQERIDTFTRQLNETQRKLDEVTQARVVDQQAFKTLSEQYDAVAESLDKVENQVSISEAPNYEDDPKGYMDWQSARTLGKIEKMLTPAKNLSPTTTQPLPTGSQYPTQPPVQEAALAAIHDDYYEVIAAVNKDISLDPAVGRAIHETPNPYKAAYEYGLRKKKVAEELRQGTLSQGYVEGSTPPVQDTNSLTPDEKTLVAKMRAGGSLITEEKYLKRRQTIAKRKGRA